MNGNNFPNFPKIELRTCVNLLILINYMGYILFGLNISVVKPHTETSKLISKDR